MIWPAAGNMLSAAMAVAFFLFILRTFLSLQSLLFLFTRLFRWAELYVRSHQTFTIPRHSVDSPENPLYIKAAAYVAALPTAEDSEHTSLFSFHSRPNDYFVCFVPGQTIIDSFLGARLSWTFLSGEGDALVLRLRRQDRHRVLRPYLRHIETVAEEIVLRRKEIKLYTNASTSVGGGGRRWRSTVMSHPATLDTVVMDPELKDRVRADLEQFREGRAYFGRIGRVWKRSYFLHGPPGTGKSSFAAAVARFLCYDVYAVDLSRVSGADDLRSLLLDTSPRSVILFEDLNRFLSGVLCFLDGVLSYCGEERIIVFTASGEEEVARLDPAVFRADWVDLLIPFRRCDFTAFKTMVSNYIGVTDHKLYAQVEEGFKNGGKLSHAELGEILLDNRGSPSRSIKNVISALQRSSSSLASTAAVEKKDCGVIVEEGGRESKKFYGLIRMQSWSKKERRRSMKINVPVAGD